MLDVSIRTGVMNLMIDLAQKLEVSYLYITHDLAVARYTSDDLAVMYMGKIVEYGPTEEVLHHPLHPYTRALISAVPVPDPTFKRGAPEIKGASASRSTRSRAAAFMSAVRLPPRSARIMITRR